jgi:hypothetical protein
MKVSTILDHIDSGHIALPEFQRGYVWNREQVRGLMSSLYRRYPVGGLMVWVTESESATHRGDGQLAPGVVKLLLDGQQRMTTLYGVLRGKPPLFFDGNAQAFTGIQFHLAEETFEFYAPAKMKDNPLWIDVTQYMQAGFGAVGMLAAKLAGHEHLTTYIGRVSQLLGLGDIELHVEEVTGKDKSVDVVVDIFNRVNSGGTKLSKGDLALAKICAGWPEARDTMKEKLAKWKKVGFYFDLDWYLRCTNTVLTNTAFFSALKDKTTAEFQQGLTGAERAVDYLLNLLSSRLGIDHDRVLGGRYALPLLCRYVAQRGGKIDDPKERARMLYWYIHSFLWGRYSSAVESTLNQDLAAIQNESQPLERLIANLRQERGDLQVKPGDFAGWNKGSRFYPMLYLMTRVCRARDWDTDIELSLNLLGKLSSLQLHHIFPKAQLYKVGKYTRAEVNALANFTFLTQETNLKVSDRLPEEYLPEFIQKHPAAVQSHWIPDDPALWKLDRYKDFLAARRELLAKAANTLLETLATEGIEQAADITAALATRDAVNIGGFADADEERQIIEINDWVAERGLARGVSLYELSDTSTGALLGILDLAWPSGVQAGLTEPVAVLLDEDDEMEEACRQAGYRIFTTSGKFKRYVERRVLAAEAA